MTTDSVPVLHASLLVYDIPSASKLPNPSGYLRRRGIRINLSCWVIPHGNEPYALLDNLTRGGALWKMTRFDPSDAANLLATCINALKTDIRNAMHRSGEAMQKAQSKACEGVDSKKELRLYTKRAGSTVKRLRTLLKDFEHVAAVFGIDPDRQLSIPDALTAVNALDASVKTKSELYAKAIADCRELATVDSLAMANAASSDDVPALILADWLDDHGGDGAALREAFSVA